MKIRTIAAGLLLAGLFSVGISAVPSHATDWKVHEAKRIEEQNRRRAEELEKAKSEQEARDKARRMYYEEQRKRDLERKMYYQDKYGK